MKESRCCLKSCSKLDSLFWKGGKEFSKADKRSVCRNKNEKA